jgi:hypothetical protein
MAAASDRHAARPVFLSVCVLIADYEPLRIAPEVRIAAPDLADIAR